MKKRILFTAVILSLVACNSVDMFPGAEQVHLSQQIPSNKNCKFLGDVATNYSTSVDGSESGISDAQADIKNKAFVKGGNVAVMTTGPQSRSSSTAPLLYANVYKCPPHLIGSPQY